MLVEELPDDSPWMVAVQDYLTEKSYVRPVKILLTITKPEETIDNMAESLGYPFAVLYHVEGNRNYEIRGELYYLDEIFFGGFLCLDLVKILSSKTETTKDIWMVWTESPRTSEWLKTRPIEEQMAVLAEIMYDSEEEEDSEDSEEEEEDSEDEEDSEEEEDSEDSEED